MEGKIIKEVTTPEFKPFKLELMVNSIEDARLLFHIFNNGILSDVINGENSWYDMKEFTKVSGDLSRNRVSENIDNHLRELGFNV